MAGFYLMHRGWLDNPAFGSAKKEPFCRRSAWAWIVEHALFSPARVSIAGKAVELTRGQLSYSLRDLARQWGWAEARVRRFLGVCASANMISCVTDARQMVITVCNYDRYQFPMCVTDAEKGASVTQLRRTTDAHNKEGKEVEDSKEADASLAAGGMSVEGGMPEVLDAAAVLIPRCTRWLAKATGKAERDVRALVVKMLRDHGDGAVIEVFTAASRAPPAEPISWITAQLKRRTERNGTGRASAHSAETAAFEFVSR